MSETSEGAATPPSIFSDEEFNEIFQQYVEMGKEVIEGSKQTLLDPLLFVHNSDEPITINVVQAFEDDETKPQRMTMIGKLLAEKKIILDAAVLMSEVWISNSPPVDPDEEEKGNYVPVVRPSQDPLRKEGIVFTAMSMDRKVSMAIYEIKRDEDGFVHVGELNQEHIHDSTSDKNGVEANILYYMYQGYAAAYMEQLYLGELEKSLEDDSGQYWEA